MRFPHDAPQAAHTSWFTRNMTSLLTRRFFSMQKIALLLITLLHVARPIMAQSPVIAVTGNTAGALEDCACGDDPAGGMARRFAVVDSLRALYPSLILLDTGDLLSSWPDFENDSLLTVLYRKLAYDAIAPGEYEFTYGPVFHESMQALPFVSASLPDLPATKILNKARAPIWLTSLTDPDVFTYRDAEQRPAEILPIERALPRAAPGADTSVVVLFHGKPEKLRVLAETLPDGSLVVLGHWHRTFQPERDAIQRIGKITIVNPGEAGEYVLLLKKEKTWRAELIRLNARISARPLESLLR